MGFRCGIIGLPNVGKTTIFNALSHGGGTVAAHPYSTVEPKKGIVEVPDDRLDQLHRLVGPEKKRVPTHIEFIDIAGLMKGASQGQGLGNQFLSYIKDVDTILHVVRCFHNPEVVHVLGEIDPLRDIEVVNLELTLKDLETVTKHLERTVKLTHTGDRDAEHAAACLTKVKEGLERGFAIRKIKLADDESRHLLEIHLLTDKPVMYVANVDEADLPEGGPLARSVQEFSPKEGAPTLVVAGKFEADLAHLPEQEKVEFLKGYGLEASTLTRVTWEGYKLLDIVTFFTTDGPEVRAWTVRRGTHAPKAAAKIHSDFERGFIRAEVVPYEALIHAGSYHHAREEGHVRIEGKDYVVHDGDVIHFRFNV